MEKHAKPKKKGNLIFSLLILLCLAVMGFSLYKIISISMEYREGEKEYDILQSYTTALDADGAEGSGEEKGSAGQTEEESKDAAASGKKKTADRKKTDSAEQPGEEVRSTEEVPLSVDFENLKAINPDIVCWLYIPVLDISYPVVQAADNDYYLHRTFERTENFAGSLFVEAGVSHPMKDPHTIIYGHSMKNQTMFGKLKFLLQDDLYRQDPVFWIFTEEGAEMYQMADIRYTESGSSLYTLFEAPDSQYMDFLSSIYAESGIQNDSLPEITPDCRLVTLSTCAAAEGTGRLVVIGVAG